MFKRLKNIFKNIKESKPYVPVSHTYGPDFKYYIPMPKKKEKEHK